MLLSRGRSNLAQLAQYTSMNPRQLRHGLAVLIQFNLLFHQSDGANTVYEANAAFAYNLIRTGKILEMVESSFGPVAKEVMQNLMISGQTRVSDLLAAYQIKIDRTKAAAEQDMDLEFPEFKQNGVNGNHHEVKSTAQLNSIICRLVEAELIDVVHSKSFQSPDDIVKEAESQVVANYFPNGVKGGKGKAEYEQKVAEALRKIRSESKSLKRKLESNGAASKRRKLFTGIGQNGTSNGIAHGTANGANGANGAHEEEMDPALDVSIKPRMGF